MKSTKEIITDVEYQGILKRINGINLRIADLEKEFENERNFLVDSRLNDSFQILNLILNKKVNNLYRQMDVNELLFLEKIPYSERVYSRISNKIEQLKVQYLNDQNFSEKNPVDPELKAIANNYPGFEELREKILLLTSEIVGSINLIKEVDDLQVEYLELTHRKSLYEEQQKKSPDTPKKKIKTRIGFLFKNKS